MKTILKSRQSGFAIIEALIAFLLLGIGVAALLYLQGNLMVGSSTSKARAEAMELAKDRTEVLRSYIDKDQYLSALVSVSDESGIPGVNATYIVSYTILQNNDVDPPSVLKPINETTNQPRIGTFQNLTVKVNWTGSEGNSEQVSLETMLYYMSPVVASGIVTSNGEGGDAFPLLSPLITGVEGEHPSTKKFSDDEIENAIANAHPDNLGLNLEGDDEIVSIRTYLGGTGRSNVEVVHNGEVVLTSFGGIVHKLQGEVILSNSHTTMAVLNSNLNLKILASPPSFCVFPINSYDANGDGDNDVASYVCYVPGDCTYGSIDINGLPDTRCPVNFIPPTDIGFDDLNGGWYGRIGNFGIALNPDDKVCTFETDVQNILTPSRNYIRYRWGCVNNEGVPLLGVNKTECSGNVWKIIGNEGINTPYSNQTFLIVTKQPPTDCGSVGVPLVTSQIKGPLLNVAKKFDTDGSPTGTWDKNVVLPENECLTPTNGACL